jgi:tripartite motif-containing protein 71
VAVDDEGRIIVADSGNSRIQVFAPDGTFLAKWGGRGWMGRPKGVAVDGEGRIIVADSLWGQICAVWSIV